MRAPAMAAILMHGNAGAPSLKSVDTLDGLEVQRFEDAAGWEAWLADHHADRAGVWLTIARKGSSQPSVTIAEALDVALCYGWIDSQRRGLDAASYLQKYTPRRPAGSWSKVNVAKVEALTAAGRMRPPGLAAVAAAKADGRWAAAYESQRLATVPPDLAEALASDDAARARFEALGRTGRYGLILWVLKSRGPAERAKRLRQVIDELRG